MRRSSGTTPVAFLCSASSRARFSTALSSSPSSCRRSAVAVSNRGWPASAASVSPVQTCRMKAPSAVPNPQSPAAAVPMPERQTGRPAPVPGVTITRSRVILLNLPCGCTQGDDVARHGTRTPFPRRVPPTLRGPLPPSVSGSTTVYSPRSGIVPPLVTASRCAPGRAGDQVLIMVPHQAGTEGGEVLAVVGPPSSCPSPSRMCRGRGRGRVPTCIPSHTSRPA